MYTSALDGAGLLVTGADVKFRSLYQASEPL